MRTTTTTHAQKQQKEKMFLPDYYLMLKPALVCVDEYVYELFDISSNTIPK